MRNTNEMEIRFDGKSANEGFARVAVASFMTQLNPTVEEVADVKTAVSEAVTNAIIHGYENEVHKVSIRCRIEENVFTVEVSDKGKGIEDIEEAMRPMYTTKPEQDRSGMGFAFMEAFMDSVEVESEPGKIRKSHDGDKEAREQLVEENVGLVWCVVRRFYGRGTEAEDLFQIGSIGLLKAIDKFDLSYDVKFSTYAVPMISGEIKRFLRDDGMIKVSRSLKELAARSLQAREKLTDRLGREPTLEELSVEMGVDKEEIVQAMEAGSEVESLYRPIHQKEGSEIRLLDKIEEKERREERILDRMVLKQLIESLEPKERQLIYLRYFAEKTQSDVGKIMGISQVQVSRLEKRILEDLRRKGG